MKKKLLVYVIIVSLLTSIIGIAFDIHQVTAANENVALSMSPNEIHKGPADINSFFDLYLDIANVTDLWGFDINITWHSWGYLTLDEETSNANTAGILDTVWGAGQWVLIMNKSSNYYPEYFYRVIAVSTNHGFSGDSHLIKMHFKIIGNSNMDFSTAIYLPDWQPFKLSDSNWSSIPATTHNAIFRLDALPPGLEFDLVDPDPGKPFEYGKTFQIEVYALNISDPLTSYTATFDYDSEVLNLTDVVWTIGVNGWIYLYPGMTTISASVPSPYPIGDKISLFTINFRIQFDDRSEHIWRQGGPYSLVAPFSFRYGEVGVMGWDWRLVSIYAANASPPLDITVNLIRGDVDCNGKVSVFDLRTVAAYYDAKSTDPIWATCSKYDLTQDNTIDIFDLVAVATNIGYGGP